MAAPTFGTYVVMNPVTLAALLRGPTGPVMRRMAVDAEAVRQEAKRRVGVHKPVPGERRSRRPGTLRDSIVVRAVDGPAFVVGSEDPIALLHHEGTPRHYIHGKPLLYFIDNRRGHLISVTVVDHPGTKPNRYLKDSLSILRSRY